MLKKILLSVSTLLVLFLLFVSTRESKFHYERSGLINAPAEKIFPFISQLKLGGQWSPYEKRDPHLEKSISGTDGTPGAKMNFKGNKEVGSGSIEILSMVPNSSVDLKLVMTEPFSAENIIHYTLTPKDQGTLFTWSMEGDGGFMGKLLSVFIDCEAMIGGDMEQGIDNLRTIVVQP